MHLLFEFPQNWVILFFAFLGIWAVLLVSRKTNGRKEVKEQYPSEEIIKSIFDLDIPILLGSDAHHPSEIVFEFKKIINLLKDIGFTQLAKFDKRKRDHINI